MGTEYNGESNMEQTKFWRVGFAPFTTIPGPVFTDKKACRERARQEIRYGGYRGYALKPYECDENGNLLLPQPKKVKTDA